MTERRINHLTRAFLAEMSQRARRHTGLASICNEPIAMRGLTKYKEVLQPDPTNSEKFASKSANYLSPSFSSLSYSFRA